MNTEQTQAEQIKKARLITAWHRSKFDDATTLDEYLNLVAARFEKFYGEQVNPTVDDIYNALSRKELL
jgi:hypothetical protein